VNDGIRIHDDLTNEVRRVVLEGGRERTHPPVAAGLLVLLLMFAAVGFLAGWIVGAML